MEVADPNDTVNIAKQSHTNTLPFTCPRQRRQTRIRCEAHFDDNDDSPSYSLCVRVHTTMPLNALFIGR
ncbi:hypothetical protein C8Q80DRAFT_1167130 [Daedaleopsis nitida]|nr:hypothetical protein C8Q80DRAFT_1167130 [Daedaleopsis nitida]